MFLLDLIMLAGTVNNTCGVMDTQIEHHWLKGAFSVTPVAQKNHQIAMKSLAGANFRPIGIKLARKLIADPHLTASNKYYLTKAGYAGNHRDSRVPSGLKFSVDVDSYGLAYITSYRLTSEKGYSAVPILLSSERPLKGAVSLCGSAK